MKLGSKPGSNNPMQKGKRRQKLHDEQNNRGEPQKKPQYRDFDGNPVK